MPRKNGEIGEEFPGSYNGLPAPVYHPDLAVPMNTQPQEVQNNLRLLSLGIVDPADLGPGYGIAEDGALVVKVDGTTFDSLP